MELLGKTRTGAEGGGGGAGRFNFAEFRSRSFAFVPLHLPFVYFKVRKRRWEKATFSPLRGRACVPPTAPMKGTFVLQ